MKLEKTRLRSVHSVVFVSSRHENPRNLRFHPEVGLIASDMVDADFGLARSGGPMVGDEKHVDSFLEAPGWTAEGGIGWEAIQTPPI
jgi:hypothetical protein